MNTVSSLDLHATYVLGHDIKEMLAMIHFNLSSPHFVLNAVRSIETGRGTQLNGNATFRFCRANVDMIALGFNSMGSVNNPVCWSFIPHQAEGEKLYTLTFYKLQKAAIFQFPTKPTVLRSILSLRVSRSSLPAPMCRNIWRAIYIVLPTEISCIVSCCLFHRMRS
jgi:hypothetical protein